MSEPRVHFLNVGQGDCFLIERTSNRLTMIDICCGNLVTDEKKEIIKESAFSKPSGNYGMCKKPTNPIDYLTNHGISTIWRFILTHPDMDHMDGIKKLFDNKTVNNFWDCGIRREKPDFKNNYQYLEEDWDYYDSIINGSVSTVKVISPRAGDKGVFWNRDDEQGNGDGDYLSIISPNDELIKQANDNGDINDASYVIVYRSSGGNIIFPGDSNDKTWEYILDKHKALVSDAAVLFAPHHGRKSDRDYSFLDVVNPRISFFGCASSDDLAYSAWNNRGLLYFTNNQCGNVHVYPKDKTVKVFIENQKYAEDFTDKNTYQLNGYWFLCEV